MSRTVREIAADLRQAVSVIASTNAEMASVTTGTPRGAELPPITVRLPDGREIELGALADELIAAAED